MTGPPMAVPITFHPGGLMTEEPVLTRQAGQPAVRLLSSTRRRDFFSPDIKSLPSLLTLYIPQFTCRGFNISPRVPQGTTSSDSRDLLVQGLSDFFKTALRQKPYLRQVRHTSHCDRTARLGSSSPSLATIDIEPTLFFLNRGII